MTAACYFAIPGALDTATGGYAYARGLLRHWPECGLLLEHVALPDGFPFPDATSLDITRRLFTGLGPGRGVTLIDGLAYGALPVEIIADMPHPVIALVHHPLGLETGLSAAQKTALLESEMNALMLARHVITSSAATGRTLSELFSVEPSRVTVAAPGTEQALRASGSAPDQPLHIVSAGAIVPRKGFDVLIAALHAIRDCNWRATIAGSLDRSPETAMQIQQQIANLGLMDRIRLSGPLSAEALDALYNSADVFALATHYEGYGMVFAEAMARGLPIVCSGEGAVADTVPRSAGAHVQAGDADAFAAALRKMLEDGAFRKGCGDGSWRHGRSLPSWEDTARIIAGVVQKALQ